MAPSKLRRAIGAVKDQTSIGLAKVNHSNSLSDLEVAIVKATRHDEYPAEEKYIREIISLTCYSRHFVGACVNFIARRLNKTKTWVVALKTLMLIRRLLTDGDPAYEQEIFFATRRGTRFLNLSDFRDTSRSDSWDYSAFVRTYALYLDDRLEYKMQGRRKKLNACTFGFDQDGEEREGGSNSGKTPPPRDMTIEQLLAKIQHLQQLLERFLATKPTGNAKHNRVVIVALYPIVKESNQIYYDMTDILSIFIDKFMELDIADCVKIYNVFSRVSKQFDELDAYYSWCKDTGVARSSEYPEVERITAKKLELMDDFIREKSAAIYNRGLSNSIEDDNEIGKQEEETVQEDMNQIKALPPPEDCTETAKEEKKQEESVKIEDTAQSQEADLVHLGDDAVTSEDQADKLALALFDGGTAEPAGPAPPPVWEAFNETSDWETALVQSASYLPHQKVSLGGGFDPMLLDGLYQRGARRAAAMSNNYIGGTGSASSIAFGSAGNPSAPMLALPAPPPAQGAPNTNIGNLDPFAPSAVVPPPAYVQMTDMEKKQRLLLEEQLMWQQYMRDGMQGHRQMANYQGRPSYMGGYPNGYGY